MKIFRKAVGMVLVLSLSITPVSIYAASYSGIQKISIDGLSVVLSADTVEQGDQVLVALKDFDRMLGVKTIWDVTTKTCIVKKGDSSLYATIGKVSASLDGEEVILSTPPVLNDKTPFLPLKDICEIFGYEEIKNEDGTITISSGIKQLSVLKDGIPMPSDMEIISFDAALKKTIASNSNLKGLEENMDILDLSLKTTRDNYTNPDIYGMSIDLGFDEYEIPYSVQQVSKTLVDLARGINNIETTKSTLALTEEILKDSSELMLISSLTDIENTRLDIKLLEESLILSEANVENLTVKNGLGMASDNELKLAKINLDQSKTTLEILNLNLDNNIQSLNKLLKQNMKNPVYVEYKPEIAPVNIISLDSYTSDKVKQAPSVKIKELEVDQAKYKYDTSDYSYDGTGMDLLSAEAELNTVRRELSDTKLNIESSVRSNYLALKQLESNAVLLELDLEKAIDTYNNAVTAYETGSAILYQVDQAKLAILNIEVSIEKNKLNYNMLKYLLNKPYLESYIG